MYYSLRSLLKKDNYADFMSKIPANAKVLNLEQNALFDFRPGDPSAKWTDEELIQIFSAIPPSIEKLVLRENVQGLVDSHQLEIILKHMPKTVTCLDLGQNPLGQMTLTDTIRIFASIPSNICQLILDFTELWYRNDIMLNNIMLDKTDIRFTDNQVAIFAAIPSHVEQITFSVLEFPSDENQLLALANALPYVENLILKNATSSLKHQSQVSILKENSGKYPRIVEAYEQLSALPILPKPLVHEIVAQFLEEDEAAVLRILEASFFNHSTVSSATDVIQSAARDLQAPSG